MFDSYDRGFLADPYPIYARIRQESPVFFDDRWGLTFIARHEDVTTMLDDRERFGRDFRHRPGAPRHTRLRRLVSKAFTRRSSEVFRPRLEQAADAILDSVVETGSMEVVSEYATPIPLAMIAELMGIPSEDHMRLVEMEQRHREGFR